MENKLSFVRALDIIPALLYVIIFLYYYLSGKTILDYIFVMVIFIALHVHAAYTIRKHKNLTLKQQSDDAHSSKENSDMAFVPAVSRPYDSLIDASPLLADEPQITEYKSESSLLQKDLINLFVNDKVFLIKNISIEEVSNKLNVNKSYLSKVINAEMNRNFRELVNYYRIKEAVKIFSVNDSLRINDLCDLCGFKNIASFNNAFKTNMGNTPGEWCKMMKIKKNEIWKKKNHKESGGSYV